MMPRSGWVAVGAVGAAIAITVTADAGLPSAGLAVVFAASGVAVGALMTIGRARPRLTAALIGAVLVAIRVIATGGTDSGGAAVPLDTTSKGPWPALVVSIGTPRDGQQVATVEIASQSGPTTGARAAGSDTTVGAPAVGAGAAAPATAIRVAATMPRYPTIRPGLRIRLSGRLQALADDDYGRYLAGIGVSATIRATDLAVTGDVADAGSVIEGIRRAGDEALTRSLPEPEAGLASGILIGLRDRVDRDLAAAFVSAGVSHVVAISGWNIAIVGAAIGAVLRGWPRRRRTVATLLAIFIYTILTGASPSVLRAAVMAAVVLTARESGRPGRAAAALGWAIAGLLVTGPSLVTDPGFALSAAATGGLIAWATPLTDRIASWRGGVLPGWLAGSLGVSLAAEFATLPIALLWFGRVAIIAPAVNLAVVPLVAPAMAAGTLALIGGFAAAAGMPGIVATVLGLPGWIALAAIVAIVRAAAVVPFASATLPPPANVLAAVIAASVILGVAGRTAIRAAL
ncbi:MAG TPA: ComEC/Rec2 family competence protein, partial [Candidatus Acidoferrum sp.]|nr:ComEC/Rec2 family competence protein [Candidatus Acidoferrum sp.]